MLNVALEATAAPEVDPLPDGSAVELHFELEGSTLDLLLPWDAFVRTIARAAVVVAEREAEADR